MTLDLMTVGHDSPHGVQLEPRACTHCGSLSASYPSFGFRCCIERDGMSLLRFFTRVTCDIIFRTWFLSPIVLFFRGVWWKAHPGALYPGVGLISLLSIRHPPVLLALYGVVR